MKMCILIYIDQLYCTGFCSLVLMVRHIHILFVVNISYTKNIFLLELKLKLYPQGVFHLHYKY